MSRTIDNLWDIGIDAAKSIRDGLVMFSAIYLLREASEGIITMINYQNIDVDPSILIRGIWEGKGVGILTTGISFATRLLNRYSPEETDQNAYKERI